MTRRRFAPVRRSSIARMQSNAAYKSTLHVPACYVCGYTLSVTIHHMIRMADGGMDHPVNKIPLCPLHHAIADKISCAHKNIRSRETMAAMIREAENHITGA